MKNKTIVVALLLLSSAALSQNTVFRLHPVVGDTIDQTEKSAYLLFSQLVDSSFKEGWIGQTGTSFVLHACLTSGTVTLPLDTATLAEYKSHVEKLSAYYASLAESSTDDAARSLAVKDPSSSGEKRGYQLTDEMWNKIKKDANRHAQLSHSADIQGLTGRAKEDYINTAGQIDIRIDAGKK